MTSDRLASYRIYLLTFWLEEGDDLADPETWRFRLEEPRRGRQQGCVGVTDLLAELVRAIGDGEDPSNDAQ
jgi:hypothetical protein